MIVKWPVVLGMLCYISHKGFWIVCGFIAFAISLDGERAVSANLPIVNGQFIII